MLVSLLPVAVAGYLLGSIPTGVLLARAFGWPDPRQHGSGHTGALNVSRGGGAAALVVVALADLLKGFAAVWLSTRLSGHAYAITVGGIMAVVGHCWPVWLGFHGGMGLATSAGAALAYSPLTIVAAGLSLLVIRFFVIRHTPRATISTMVLVPPALHLLREPRPVLWLGTGMAILIALRHTADWNRIYERQ